MNKSNSTWYVSAHGGVYGPMNDDELIAMRARGELSDDASVGRNDGAFLPLAETQGLPFLAPQTFQHVPLAQIQKTTSKTPYIFATIIAFIAFSYYAVEQEDKRHAALTPNQRYQEICKNSLQAYSISTQFLKQHLNLAETPKFELNYSEVVKQKVSQAGDCISSLEGFIIFKNETAGQSRREVKISVTPVRDDTKRWQMTSLQVFATDASKEITIGDAETSRIATMIARSTNTPEFKIGILSGWHDACKVRYPKGLTRESYLSSVHDGFVSMDATMIYLAGKMHGSKAATDEPEKHCKLAQNHANGLR